MTRSVEIPDEAVEAAAAACRESDFAWSTEGIHDEYWRKLGRAALDAALPYLALEVVINHRPGVTCSVIANVDPETGFARVPAGDGGLREALAAKPFCSHTHRRLGCPYCDCNEDLQRIVAAHPAAPAVPQPVDREALSMVIWRAMPGNVSMRDSQAAADAVLALLGGSVLAGEQEQVAPE